MARSSIEAESLHARMASGTAPAILDVRSGAEFRRGHLQDAIHLPFWAIPWRARHLPVRRDAPLVVYCGHGPRARLAQALLRILGFTRVSCLAGHLAAWRRAGLPERSR